MASKSILLKTVIVAVALVMLFIAVSPFLPESNPSQALPSAQLAEPDSALVCFQSACINAELAETGEERSQGLMFREHLEEGMLFVFETESIHSFWMKNTLIPLDMIWIGKNKQVVHLEHAVLCTTENCGLYTPSAPALYVLETNAGFVETNGVSVGDTVGIDYN